FAGMCSQAKARVLGFLKELAEGFRPGAPFVPANPDANDARGITAQLRCLAKDAGRLLRAKLTDRVEDPIERDPELPFGANTGGFHSMKKRLKLDPSPVKDHPDRN